MSKEIQKSSEAKLQQEELRRRMLARLAPQVQGFQKEQPRKEYSRTSCILYDTSGSMSEFIGANVRKIDALRKVAQDFVDVRGFHFGISCEELKKGQKIPSPWGGTAMDRAFMEVKRNGITHVVIVTDGRPDNEIRALQEAKGLVVDVFYVGDDPCPPFLIKLCNVTGGQFGKASLMATKELGTAMKERLGIAAPKEEGKGPIIL